jgi:pimeloyl-ACP methyl ester carboxylesterase
MRVHFEEVGGAQTRYLRAGSGMPVLLLHGVGMTADSWCRTIGPLSASFDVIAPDLLDNGFTGPGAYAGGPPHNAILDHLEALVDHLGLASFAVIGSSFGATLAVLLHHRRPRQISRLVITSSGSVFKKAEALAEMYAKSLANGGAALRNPTLEVCRQRLGNLFHDPEKIPPELLQLQLTPYALPHAAAAFERRVRGMMDVAAMRPFETADKLKAVSVPMLAVWGKQDPRGEHALATQVFAGIPNAQFITFDPCGHLPHLECDVRFNATARDFLKAN